MGAGYASFAKAHPNEVDIVAVAEPNEFRRRTLASEYGIPERALFSDWRELAAQPKPIADAVVIATQDRQHKDPAIALARQGYHMLLEKPMAPTEAECREIAAAVKQAGGAIRCRPRHAVYTLHCKAEGNSGLRTHWRGWFQSSI